ncbi:mitochondrial genome maintenance protein [Parastagonospora nodorum]|nr:mitochondrial genome maintenance protein [Parastagonospora nodorum]KAH5777111.1 mitochondrial genome maintenance protein [Parastagonospora nodorum]KAH6074370.1 mitochondrial genome maintenance protein [Parastagonospora nodorum]KAH6088393.1 mitochondrial genome maintenance protein [Parastagonospora nodorum]
MTMATTSARKGFSALLNVSASSRAAPSAYRISHRSISSTASRTAWVSSSKAAPASTTSTAKPSTTTSTKATPAKPAASSTTTSARAAAAAPQRTVTPSFPATEPPVPTHRNNSADAAANDARSKRSLTDGLFDAPPEIDGVPAIDWTRSYHGLGSISFTPEQSEILLAPTVHEDVEVKPDGILYLPEIKYRRILNKAFGPGGWGLAPRGESIVTGKIVTREYGLIVQGRLVSIARGEQQYFDPDGIPTATEGCKSNALMRCCKDLGIASELWDPRFIREFSSKLTREVWVEHVSTKKKRKIVVRKDDQVKYPFKEVKA